MRIRDKFIRTYKINSAQKGEVECKVAVLPIILHLNMLYDNS
jgi:hypothetical protein